ncbi:MAG TPA: dockerin type I repeat-containing protein [Candidatus Methanoperedens sp.]
MNKMFIVIGLLMSISVLIQPSLAGPGGNNNQTDSMKSQQYLAYAAVSLGAENYNPYINDTVTFYIHLDNQDPEPQTVYVTVEYDRNVLEFIDKTAYEFHLEAPPSQVSISPRARTITRGITTVMVNVFCAGKGPCAQTGLDLNITPVMKGDVDLNKCVNTTDAVYVAQYLAGQKSLTPVQLKAADINNEGAATIIDALFIAKWSSDPVFRLMDIWKNETDRVEPIECGDG